MLGHETYKLALSWLVNHVPLVGFVGSDIMGSPEQLLRSARNTPRNLIGLLRRLCNRKAYLRYPVKWFPLYQPTNAPPKFSLLQIPVRSLVEMNTSGMLCLKEQATYSQRTGISYPSATSL